MGSELFTNLVAQGQDIERGGGESMVAYPEAFAIIGLDITPEKLTALYPDAGKMHARARAIIAGIRDKTRVAKPPPAAFVATLRNGVRQPITLANLGPDRKGKIWIVTALGRQRNMGLRMWNKTHPEQTWKIRGILEPFAHNDKAGIDAEIEALEANGASNVFVAEPPSTKADRAQMLTAKGKAPADVAITIGARDAAEVVLLVSLAECHDDVKAAVDEGRIGLAMVADLAKHPHAEQARRVARKAAGPGKAAKDAASKPRAKALPRPVVEAMAARMDTQSKDEIPLTYKDVGALLRYISGDREQANGRPWLVTLGTEAQKAAKGGGA